MSTSAGLPDVALAVWGAAKLRHLSEPWLPLAARVLDTGSARDAAQVLVAFAQAHVADLPAVHRRLDREAVASELAAEAAVPWALACLSVGTDHAGMRAVLAGAAQDEHS